MRNRFLTFLPVLIVLLALSGCACKHEWAAADCVNPQICTKCGEAGGPALGHEWLDAACTAPETCTRCGVTEGNPLDHEWIDATCVSPQTCSCCSETQGEALAHSYGAWFFGEEDMNRTCSVCSFVDIQELDREIYLKSQLPGYWDFYGMINNSEFIPASRLELAGIRFYFGTDGTATFYMPQGGTQQVSWSFDSYEQDANSIDSYFFTLTGETATYGMCLRLGPTGENRPEKELILLSNPLLMFSRYDELEHELITNWGTATDTYGNILGSMGNWLTFRSDRTVTGYLNGAVDGIWYVVPVYYDSWNVPSEYAVIIENSNGGTAQQTTAYLSPEGNTLGLYIGRSYNEFEQIDEAALEQIQIGGQVHLGTWTSTEVRARGELEEYTTKYTVTFNEDGTFTAKLDKQLHGTWTLRDISDSSDKDWTNGNESPIYRYYMYADGLKEEIYCNIDLRSEIPVFYITYYQPWEATQITFRQLAEEDAELFMKVAYQPVGTWGSEDPESSDTLTIRNDFTFSGNLNDEDVSGTWNYQDNYFDPEKYHSEPESAGEHYYLEIDGGSFEYILINNGVIYIAGEAVKQLVKSE